MVITIKTFLDQSAPTWHWPVRIGLVEGNENLKALLLNREWANKFCEIELLNGPIQFENGRFDILIFPTGASRYIDQDSKQSLRLVGTCIILFEDSKDINNKLIDSYLLKFAKLLSSKGIFIIDPGPDLSTWLEGIMVRLSHNQDIVTALRDEKAVNGFFLIDPILERITTISYAVECITDQLKYKSDSLFNIFWITENRQFTNAQLSELLLKTLRDSKFMHEYGGASTFADATRDIYRQLETPEASHFYPELSEDYDTEESSFDFYGDESTAVESSSDSGQDTDHFERGLRNISSRKEPRFLQAQVFDYKNDVVLFIEERKDYTLKIKIGDDDLFQSGLEPFPSEVVFDTSKRTEELLQLVFRTASEEKPHMETILLPRNGESTVARFNFNTGTKKEFRSELFIYHHNRLIQKALIHADIYKKGEQVFFEDSRLQVEIVFSAVKELSNLTTRQKFGASFFYEPRNSIGQIQGIVNSKPLDLYFQSEGLDRIIKNIKNDIEEAALNVTKDSTNLRSTENSLLFRNLALRGNSLFVNHLKKENSFDGPVQIVSKRTGFIPLDFLYELPPPAEDATLCERAEAALRQGSCVNCFDKSTSPAPFICPFGFWSLSRVIERHSCEYEKRKGAISGDYQVLSASDFRNAKPLEILKETVHASTLRIDHAHAGIRNQVSNAIKKNSQQFREAHEWGSWKDFFSKPKKPDSLILLVHVENDEHDQVRLEIGDGSMLLQNYLDRTQIGDSPPFIIIIGCEVTDTSAYGFDISNQLMNHGAAIVLSNFTRILGRQAGPIVIRLVELLKENKGQVITFGEVLLKLRQHLLAEGFIVSLTLMAHGDADWKIKVSS